MSTGLHVFQNGEPFCCCDVFAMNSELYCSVSLRTERTVINRFHEIKQISIVPTHRKSTFV